MNLEQWLQVVPFAGQFMIAGTAVLVAFKAYPWQKSIDRKEAKDQAKRAAYQNFAQELNSYVARVALGTKVEDSSTLQEHYIRVIAASSELIVYAPKDVIEECQKYSEAAFRFSDEKGFARGLKGYSDPSKKGRDKISFDELRQLRRNAMISLRQDATGEPRAAAERAMQAFFVKTIDLE